MSAVIKPSVLTVVLAVCLVSAGLMINRRLSSQSLTPSIVPLPGEITVTPAAAEFDGRVVTFRSHLVTCASDDPIVSPGETVEVFPASDDFYLSERRTVVVTFPEATPYEGFEQQLYFRGHAISMLDRANTRYG